MTGASRPRHRCPSRWLRLESDHDGELVPFAELYYRSDLQSQLFNYRARQYRQEQSENVPAVPATGKEQRLAC